MSASQINIKEALKKHSMFTHDRLEYRVEEVLAIIQEAKTLFMEEPSLLEIPVPVVIVGDLHGQYADLHRIFTMVGDRGRLGTSKRRFLFLGDYVDRGKLSLEVICCLLVHKLAFPRMFNLLRGNHECSLINSIYGFQAELCERFSLKEADKLWTAFNDLFNWLPLAALVHGKILCMHGGFGEALKSLDDLRCIKRPISDPNSNTLVLDLLWADPMIDLKGFVPNTMRGVSVFFGENTVNDLCKKLKVDLIVRAHQVMLNGFAFYCGQKLVTIFSAPRYDTDRNNKGAVLMVDRQLRVSFRILSPVTHATKGVENFRKEYLKNEKESAYITRKQAMEGTAAMPEQPVACDSITQPPGNENAKERSQEQN
ncbi:calcineurin-like phosphoesterase domain-containing protein [Ditylenchus destructor]|nr:calcineurin-like phosphoesterase domain-containing protein [Ditylenchus destructor]